MEIKLNLKKKKVSDVVLGDSVYCYNEFDDVFCVSKVSNLFTPTIKKEYQEKILIGDEAVYTSSIHPFYDARNKKWVESQEIDSILGMDVNGGEISISNDQSYESDSDKTFYDFTVDGYHNYFVGKNGTFALTHNSATTFFPVWHKEIEDIIVLKNNKGTEDNRVRNLDYAIQFSKIFYERFIKNEGITLFSPHDVPGLYDKFGLDGFDELYVQYENDPNIPKKKVKAQELILDILKERAETGRIYIMNMDHVNSHGSFKDQVTMSNLCVAGDTEIEILHNNVSKTIQIQNLGEYLDEGVDVLSYDLETNVVRHAKVTAFAQTSPKAKVLKVTDSYGNHELIVTPDHKIFTSNRGYVMAQDLVETDQLVFVGGESSGVIVTPLEDEIPVYDITVDGTHNFFANGVLISNCMEITLRTKPINHIDDEFGKIALCILSCINVGIVKSDKELEDLCDIIVRFLDELIDHQEYPVKAAEITTRGSRSLGIGMIGLAHYLAKLGYKYDDPQAWEAVHGLSESIQYYLLKASNQLAKEKGPCDHFSTTKYHDGILPIDTYKKEVDEICSPELQHDWEQLRKDILEHGLRHTTLTAQPPTESSSVVCNSTNGIEPPRDFLSIKQSKKGTLKQIVPQYTRLKNNYTLLWDMPSNEGYINIVAVMQKFFDQAISANWSYNPENYPNKEVPISVIVKDFLSTYKVGHKTAYYHNTYDGKTDDVTSETNTELDNLVNELISSGEEECVACNV